MDNSSLSPANANASPSGAPSGILIGARPGSVVERHIGSTMGDVVCLSPMQTGILRRFLPNGFVEFLLGNSVVKLEPGYELRINETIAIRRRPELKSKRMGDKEIKQGSILILQQILGNLICKDKDNMKKLESLYTINNKIITAGRVVALYPEGIVVNANLSNASDYSSWIFLGDNDVKEIREIDSNSSEEAIQEAITNEYQHIQTLLSLDAGMQVTIGDSNEPKVIESIWWTKGNILGRKAIFDSGKISSSILSLKPYQNALERETLESPPANRSYLRLYTEFQNTDGLLFSICGYDHAGVIANFKPPPQASEHNSNNRGRCWVPYSFFDDATQGAQNTSNDTPQISSTIGNNVDAFVGSANIALGKRPTRPIEDANSAPKKPKADQ